MGHSTIIILMVLFHLTLPLLPILRTKNHTKAVKGNAPSVMVQEEVRTKSHFRQTTLDTITHAIALLVDV